MHSWSNRNKIHPKNITYQRKREHWNCILFQLKRYTLRLNVTTKIQNIRIYDLLPQIHIKDSLTLIRQDFMRIYFFLSIYLSFISWRHRFICNKKISKNSKKLWKSIKIANIDRESLSNLNRTFRKNCNLW